MSNFTDVATLNTLWGNLKGDPLNPNWDKLKSQAKNILDEYNELMDDGIDPKNMDEVRDAICDILVFTYGLGHMAGVNIDADMISVYNSNMSKFCKDEKELVATIQFYAKKGVVVEGEGQYPRVVVRSVSEQTGTDGKLYQANKILKCVNWCEPIFPPVDAVSEETITISKAEYDSLIEDSSWLGCLQNAGVDNWSGYDYAQELRREQNDN